MGGGEILKKGFLIKSPPLEGSGIKSWRKRWFCLRSSKVLEYYKHEDGDLKGVVNLEDCKSVNSDLFHKKYKYVFNIETKERVYYMVATTQEEMREWVEAICRVCRFTTHLPPADPLSQSHGALTLPIRTSLPPQRGVAFNERFRPSENGGANSDIYSLAQAAEHEVYQKLHPDTRVPSGVPLSEALASKGIGSGQRMSSASSQTYSLTSGGDTHSSRGSDCASEPNYFTPRPGDNSPGYLETAVFDPKANYATPSSNAAARGIGHLPPQHIAKPRSHTVAPAATSTSLLGTSLPNQVSPMGIDHRTYTNPAGSGFTATGAEVLPNGYMKPRPAPERHPDYDYPPTGPPRPANTSPRQHRSALLQQASDSGLPPSPSPSPPDTPPNDPHTYINMKTLMSGVPPPIDRSKKPNKPAAPKIDRTLKPKSESGESPPQGSLRCNSASVPRVGSYSEGVFTDADIPLQTKRSLHYTQVGFDPKTRLPIPMPRREAAKAPRRVNYSDVNLQAMHEMATKREEGMRKADVCSGQADMDVLDDKGYDHLVSVDDETNPYYTHMRNFTFEEADKPEYLCFVREQVHNLDGGKEEELHQDQEET